MTIPLISPLLTMAEMKKTQENQQRVEASAVKLLRWEETGFSLNWCMENYLQNRSLKRARDIREQLVDMLEKVEIEHSSNVNDVDGGVNCSHHGPRISTDTACCGYTFANLNASLASQYGDRLPLKIPREGTKGKKHHLFCHQIWTSGGNAEKIFELFEALQGSNALDSHNYTLGISSCGRSKLWQHACWLFAHSMPQSMIQPSVFSYNATMSACRKALAWQQALHLFGEMSSKHQVKLQRHVISYNVAMSSCADGAQWQFALELFWGMPLAKIKADIVSYSAIMTTCERVSHWQRALHIFECMSTTTIQPDTICFNAAISTCEKSGQGQEALQLFQSMPAAQVVPDKITYNATISACEKSGNWTHALFLFDSIPTTILPDVITYNATISACAKVGKWLVVLRLFAQMVRFKVHPNVICYNVAIGAYAKGGQWREAVRLLNTMKDSTILPNNISYNASITACEKGGEWQQGIQLLDEMLSESNLAPDVVSFNALISACAICPISLVMDYKDPVTPNLITFSSTISACEKLGRATEAEGVLSTMRSAAVTPDIISYNASISACAKGEQWQKALSLLEMMPEARLQPNVISSSEPSWVVQHGAILSGFFYNTARLRKDGSYVTVKHPHTVEIHPTSSLFGQQPKLVCYHELVLTTKEFMRGCIEVKPEWLLEVAPHFYQSKDLDGFKGKMPKGQGAASGGFGAAK
eukprot:symbB.v1.2.032804.t1/scaffold3834.1/size49527/1